MKKLVVILFVLALSTFMPAQEPKWTVSILSGGTMNSDALVEHPYDWYPSYSLERRIKKSPISSIDVNLNVTERYGFHFSYLYYPLNKVNIERWHGWSEWEENQWKYKSYVSMWEAGPEWDFNVSKRCSVYLQLNTGRCLIDNRSKYDRDFRFNGSWMLGTAIGVRYFFTPNIGISVQAAYHYIDEWNFRNLWDARAGVSFRFKGEESAIKARNFSSDDFQESTGPDSRWMVSILPGYTLNEQRREYKLLYDYDHYSISWERSPSWSFDVNYNAKEHFGIHGSYIYLYARNFEMEPFPAYPYDEGYARKASYSLLEIGPEWRIQPFDKGQFYAQLNLGKSFVHTVENKEDFNYYTQDSWYHSGWTVGLAGGARYFFTPNIGGAVQLAWHRMNRWEFRDIIDARAGVVLRFNQQGHPVNDPAGTDTDPVNHRWTLSMLPGYTLNEISYQKSRNFPYHYTEPLVTTKKASLLSMDLSVAATDHFGFHAAYLFHKARYIETYALWYDPPVSFLANTNIHLWELGPEWTFRPFEKSELYLQVNAGKTSIINSETRRWPYKNLFENTWSVGVTAGARYFFMPNAGIAAQISCHHFADWGYSPLWDARAGIVFRF
jgi:hypothetical protein